MGFSYAINVITYIEVPRTALPADLQGDGAVFSILREKGIQAYPGRFDDYDDDPIAYEPIRYAEDDEVPLVNIQMISDAWEMDDDAPLAEEEYDQLREKTALVDPEWADHPHFSRDHALIVSIESMESWKMAAVCTAGSYHALILCLREVGISTENVEFGWFVAGDAC